jgi:subtilisin
MIEPKSTDPLGFTDALRVFRETDQELYEVVARSFNVKAWNQMMRTAREHKPHIYRGIGRGVLALKKGKHTSAGKDVRQELRNIARELVSTYKCDRGFGDVETPKQTVTVRLRHSQVVTGLPAEIMQLNHRLAQDHGGINKWTFGFDNRMFVTDIPEAEIERLRARDEVMSVEVEPIARIMSKEIPQYVPNAVNTDWGVSRCFPDNAWARGIYGKNTKLAILDTGIKQSHPAFWKNGETPYKGGWNFVASSANPADDHDHGTYCAGIICHQHTGLPGTYRGIAPGIDLYIGKVLDAKGSGSYGNIAAGIDWARSIGVDVISMSLGASQGTTALQAACDAAWYAGVVVVAASGNESQADAVSYPGKYQSVIAVAAADYDENIASFSNQGAEIEVAGPGVAIVGPWAGNTYSDYQVTNSGGLYMCASGTSAACPHVAACVGLMKCWYPAALNTDLRQWLREYARDL